MRAHVALQCPWCKRVAAVHSDDVDVRAIPGSRALPTIRWRCPMDCCNGRWAVTFVGANLWTEIGALKIPVYKVLTPIVERPLGKALTEDDIIDMLRRMHAELRTTDDAPLDT